MNKLKRRVLIWTGVTLTLIAMIWFNVKVLPFGDSKLEWWTSIVLSSGITYLFWAPINKHYQSEF